MFLRAQHFPSSRTAGRRRWCERARPRCAPHPWGVVEMASGSRSARDGTICHKLGSGVFEDGTPFAIPEYADHPPPLDLPESTRKHSSILRLRFASLAASRSHDGNAADGRYALHDFEAYDTHSASPQPARRSWSGGCACVICSRPRSALDICASGWRASSSLLRPSSDARRALDRRIRARRARHCRE